MKIIPYASSSKGNSTYIYTENARILIDAGTSLKTAKKYVSNLNAIFITHGHSDHVKGLGPIGRYYKCPVYIHPHEVMEKVGSTLSNVYIKSLMPGSEITVNDLKIKSFSTKHDSVYSYGFVIQDTTRDKKFVYVTDTGIITPLMEKFMTGGDAYFIEADYNFEMLQESDDYSEFLKSRIASAFGHLSNEDAMLGLSRIGIQDTEFVIFGHLSPKTNSPELVKKAAYKAFPDYNKDKFLIAPFDTPVEL